MQINYDIREYIIPRALVSYKTKFYNNCMWFLCCAVRCFVKSILSIKAITRNDPCINIVNNTSF